MGPLPTALPSPSMGDWACRHRCPRADPRGPRCPRRSGTGSPPSGPGGSVSVLSAGLEGEFSGREHWSQAQADASPVPPCRVQYGASTRCRRARTVWVLWEGPAGPRICSPGALGPLPTGRCWVSRPPFIQCRQCRGDRASRIMWSEHAPCSLRTWGSRGLPLAEPPCPAGWVLRCDAVRGRGLGLLWLCRPWSVAVDAEPKAPHRGAWVWESLGKGPGLGRGPRGPRPRSEWGLTPAVAPATPSCCAHWWAS